MLDLNLFSSKVSEILFLGAHCDDIEIGCGATILKLLAERKDLTITWVVFCSNPDREKEARLCANAFLKGAQKKQIIIHSFRDGFLPYLGVGPKEAFESLKLLTKPDIIFTHFRKDLHQDHRIISELTWNTFRDHLILEYEIPKYDGDLNSPNGYNSVTKNAAKKKMDLLMSHYGSQRSKDWFNPELFEALMRLRGMECHSKSGFAEAFYCHKILL